MAKNGPPGPEVRRPPGCRPPAKDWGRPRFAVPLIVLAVVGASLVSCEDESGTTSDIKGVRTYEGLRRDHTKDSVRYPQTPPVGGPHDPQFQNCDGQLYGQPLRDENAVHSLEHGAVWITYRPGLRQRGIQRLAAKVGQYGQRGDYIMLSPYPGQSAPIVLTAWGRQLRLTSPYDKRIDRFIRDYSRGPTTPEPTGKCTGGKETPL